MLHGRCGMREPPHEDRLRLAAHLYTGIGLVLAAWIAILVVRGGDRSFRIAFMLMLAATVVDATDGWLARKADVHRWTGGFDGRRPGRPHRLSYLHHPAAAAHLEGRHPTARFEWVLLIPLLASAYGFSQVEAKTADNYFLGFPSYWNIVAFYLYVLAFSGWLALATLVILGLLTFASIAVSVSVSKTPSQYPDECDRGAVGRATGRNTPVVAVRAKPAAVFVPRFSDILHGRIVDDLGPALAAIAPRAAGGHMTSGQVALVACILIKESSMQSNRRNFFKTATAALTAAPLFVPRSAWGANDRVAYGVIATGGRGRYLNDKFQQLGAQCVALCDVYEPNVQAAKKQSPGAKTYLDYHELLAAEAAWTP